MPQLIQTTSRKIEAVNFDRVILPEWREKTFIFSRPGGRVVNVDGWLYGNLLGFYPTHAHPDLPIVTIGHLKSRLALGFINDAEEAPPIVEWLWKSCPHLWTPEEPAELRAGIVKMPAEVLAWCREHLAGWEKIRKEAR